MRPQEFKVLTVSTASPEEMEDALNEYGAEGWELIGMGIAPDLNSGLAVFTRRKMPAQKSAQGTAES